MVAIPTENIIGLQGKNVLVVENEAFLADEMAKAICQAGATLLGPVPDVDGAMRTVESYGVDFAVLDLRFDDDLSFPIADVLKAKGVKVVFVAGYDDWFLPDDLYDAPVYRKPADPDDDVRSVFEPKIVGEDT